MIEIIHGDCLEVMKTFQDGRFDFVLTDPPYGHNNNNGDLIHKWEAALGRGTVAENDARPIANDGAEANELFQQCLPEFNRLLKPGCCCCCCGGGGPDPQFARWSLWMDQVFEFKQMVVWDKGPMGMGWHYRRSYETILVGMKKGAACKWYDTTQKIENIIRPIRKIIPTKEDHPTPKPVGLMEHFLKLHTQEGDTVLDPFLGGGTTAVACERLGRHCVGIEISEKFCDKARKRVQNAKDDMGLFNL